MQAEPTATPGHAAIRNAIARCAAAFRRPVLLVHGDEHRYEVERPYAGVANLTRLETFGNTAAQWLRVTVDRTGSAQQQLGDRGLHASLRSPQTISAH